MGQIEKSLYSFLQQGSREIPQAHTLGLRMELNDLERAYLALVISDYIDLHWHLESKHDYI